jgi:hypothetical protein
LKIKKIFKNKKTPKIQPFSDGRRPREISGRRKEGGS